jgi:hypothetical protein
MLSDTEGVSFMQFQTVCELLRWDVRALQGEELCLVGLHGMEEGVQVACACGRDFP